MPTLSPLLAFLSTARAGEVGTVQDPATGATVQIVAGQGYHAASGNLCRPFRVTSPQGYQGMNEGLACKDPSGHWTTSRFIVNPDDLEAPPSPRPGAITPSGAEI